jgi:1,6-anhydro-N-acetylmuramate kinase
MAYETLQGNPSNVPSVTGARHPVVQGMVVPGKKIFSIRF